MIQRIVIAIGAGVVAALLFAAMVAKGTLVATTLAGLAPLPIVIAGLGWGVDMGAVAAIVASATAAAIVDIPSAAFFGASIALPAWILSAFSTTRFAIFGATDGGKRNAAWTPVGFVVGAAALIGMLIGFGALLWLINVYGGYQKSVDELVARFAPDIEQALDQTASLPSGITVKDYASLVVRLTPLMLAVVFFFVLCANLYLGARAAQVSQALKRPWLNLPESLVLPQAMSVALVVALVLAFALGDPARQAAWIVVGVLTAAYALQGLALAHALTRRLSYRNPLLFALYLTCVLTRGWALPVIAMAGLLESFLALRAKRVAAANVKP
ncbi:MAG TPA: DUF2232 domain-containing protein [Roseiarcus sp.]|nr:DUF2232 domain-containing protein [Roseiarcus sp.]